MPDNVVANQVQGTPWNNWFFYKAFEKIEQCNYKFSYLKRAETNYPPDLPEDRMENVYFKACQVIVDSGHIIDHIYSTPYCYKILFSKSNFVGYLDVIVEEISINASSDCQDFLKENVDSLVDKIKGDYKPSDPNSISFLFWRQTRNGPRKTNRRLNCLPFSEIEDNYPKEIGDGFKSLVSLEKPDESGHIILWHGPPGCGKTWLIRSLAQYWQKKFDVCPEIILDPENFFGDASYMYDLLLSEAEVPGLVDRNTDNVLRLFIVEDHAELFANGCRNSPGFSRLLNVTDGLIGQGQRMIFLFTANEKIDQLDPAIIRAGRRLQELYFRTFSVFEAEEWLKKKGVDKALNKSEITLADLYSHLRTEAEQVSKSTEFGF